jgi:hypothetical protein
MNGNGLMEKMTFVGCYVLKNECVREDMHICFPPSTFCLVRLEK